MVDDDREDERHWHEFNERLMERLANRAMLLMFPLIILGSLFLFTSLSLGLNGLTSYLLLGESAVVALLSAAYVVSWIRLQKQSNQAWQNVLARRAERQVCD